MKQPGQIKNRGYRGTGQLEIVEPGVPGGVVFYKNPEFGSLEPVYGIIDFIGCSCMIRKGSGERE